MLACLVCFQVGIVTIPEVLQCAEYCMVSICTMVLVLFPTLPLRLDGGREKGREPVHVH